MVFIIIYNNNFSFSFLYFVHALSISTFKLNITYIVYDFGGLRIA